MTNHPTASTLAAYRVGRTGPVDHTTEQVDDHLLACARCRAGLGDDTPQSELMRSWHSIAAEIGIDDASDADIEPRSTGLSRRSGVGRYLSVAACLALVAVAAVLVAVRRDPPAPAAPSLPAGFVDLGSVDDLAPGEVRWFEQHRLYLVRSDTEILALSQKSPHSGCRLATRDELDTEFFGPGAWFADPCHGSAFLLDGTRVGGPSSRGMYRYRVDSTTGRVVVDLRLVIPGPSVDPGLAQEETPTPGPGAVDDLALGWLAAAGAAVEPIRDGNDGPLLWPLGAFHDADTGLVTVPLTVGDVFGVLQVGSFEVMEHWDYDTLDVIVPGEQTAVGILNVYTASSDRTAVYVELTLPDDTGVKLRLDGFDGQWETAADVLLQIVAAHGGGV
jgi:nitrite reductase/ring-hydroxylating ferredoxin subunit